MGLPGDNDGSGGKRFEGVGGSEARRGPSTAAGAKSAAASAQDDNFKGTAKAYLSRRYHLSASHRLHTESYTDERNREVYGKCNNPHGHGHNYVIEVTLGGPVHAVTGMVCDLAELDGFARTNLVERFDHMNLNTLDAFREVVSTTENFTIEVHRIFAGFRGAKLERVRIEETSNNSFEYEG